MIGKHTEEAQKIKQLEETLIDEIDGFYQKEKAQIIKLPITDQSHR